MFWHIISTVSVVGSVLLGSVEPQARSTGPAQDLRATAANADAGGQERGNASLGRTSAAIGGPASNTADAATAPAGTTILIQPAPVAGRIYNFDTSVGSAAPPPTLGGYPMTPFAPDPTPLYLDVTTIQTPCPIPNEISFSVGLNHRAIGSGWLLWSHGYWGDVYYTNGCMSVTISFPAPAHAFCFYVEPNPFSLHTFTVTAYDGSSTSFQAHGSGGAAYCGVFGAALNSITISSDTDFAIGEFAMACGCPPITRACCYELVPPAYCLEDVDILECIETGGRWDIDAMLCSALAPPCGEYLGACCYGPEADPGYEPFQCAGDLLQWECMYLSEYTNWSGGESCADPLFLCPGTPAYCDGSGGCDEFIARVQIGEIDNSSACARYSDYTHLVTTVVPGVAYPIIVTNGTPYSSDVCSIWVDWNQDKTYADAAPELIGDVVGGGVSPPYSFELTVPATFAPGYTRMRIRIDYANPDPDPCGTTTYGEVEDYGLLVSDGTDPGACCNIYDGACIDELTTLECVGIGAGWQWHYLEACAALVPPCGDPGCCCWRPEPGVPAQPYEEFRENCHGRFLPGVLGAECNRTAFTPSCGPPPMGVLYAPSQADNPSFRAALAALLLADVDYWNAQIYGTPTIDYLLPYAAVITWCNYPYADNVALGNNLADYVDAGGRVILGQWCRQSDQYNYLSGRIMSDPAYCPVAACSTSFGAGAYGLDGATCAHDGPFGEVGAHDTLYLDVVSSLAPAAYADGTIGNSYDAVFHLASEVWYSPGNTGTDYGSGDWASLTANMTLCHIADHGACCEPMTAECLDSVPVLTCLEFGPHWRPYPGASCSELIPPCGNPGACCDVQTGNCIDDVLEAVCESIGHQAIPSQECGELEPPCGDPGCCCDYPEPGEVTEPFFAFEANCDGRFIPGAYTLCGDLDENGAVDMADFDLFLDVFGKCSGQPGFLPAADLDGDGCITLVDFQQWRYCYQYPGTDCIAEAFDPPCGLQLIAVDSSVGSAAPPPTLCEHSMAPVPIDPRPLYVDVSSLPTACPVPDAITVNPAVNHRRIGSGWMNWSHGYVGDVYYSNGASSVTLTMPVATPAVYFYVEPNPFALHTFQVLVNGEYLSEPFTAHGSAGAAYVGVCGSPVETIVLTCTSGVDFAIGEFGTTCLDPTGACCDESCGACVEDIPASTCIWIPHHRFAPYGMCAQFDPPCGEIRGAYTLRPALSALLWRPNLAAGLMN